MESISNQDFEQFRKMEHFISDKAEQFLAEYQALQKEIEPNGRVWDSKQGVYPDLRGVEFRYADSKQMYFLFEVDHEQTLWASIDLQVLKASGHFLDGMRKAYAKFPKLENATVPAVLDQLLEALREKQDTFYDGDTHRAVTMENLEEIFEIFRKIYQTS
jgi:hypothetical protein